MKILLVDDDPTTRKLLSLFLKTRGYEVVCAENGLDGIEKLGAEEPNLIVTDLNMPYMDGIEFVKSVRSDPARAALPILMVTTEADPEERDRALAAGVNAFLVKPVSADAITQNIKHILKNMFTQGGPHA